MDGDVYQELTKKVGIETSKYVPEIWKILCSKEEADLLNALPATAADLAERFGKTADDIDRMTRLLFRKGVLYEGSKGYHMSRSIVQFHDSTTLWPEAPPELIKAWRRYIEEEYPQYHAFRVSSRRPPIFRVVPINEKIEVKNQVLAYEDAVGILEKASNLAVANCPCRMIMGHCDKPLEACLQMNKGADYAIKRGTGRKIDLHEAKAILMKAEEAGLVHMTGNRAGIGTVICNCCSCCCIALSYEKNAVAGALYGQVNPSRYRSCVDDDVCTGCGLCIDACPMGNIILNAANQAEAGEACLGCGLCTHVCPVDALHLTLIRQVDHIPD